MSEKIGLLLQGNECPHRPPMQTYINVSTKYCRPTYVASAGGWSQARLSQYTNQKLSVCRANHPTYSNTWKYLARKGGTLNNVSRQHGVFASCPRARARDEILLLMIDRSIALPNCPPRKLTLAPLRVQADYLRTRNQYRSLPSVWLVHHACLPIDARSAILCSAAGAKQ